MKANSGKGNVESRDEWETPQWLFDKLHEQYHFRFDCCSNKGNFKAFISTSNFEGMKKTQIESSMCWMNPPYSKAKVMFKHFFKVVRKGVAIYRCDNFETRIWQEIIFPNVDWVFIPDKRVKYEGFRGDGARFPSALIGVGVGVPRRIKGTVLRTREVE